MDEVQLNEDTLLELEECDDAGFALDMIPMLCDEIRRLRKLYEPDVDRG